MKLKTLTLSKAGLLCLLLSFFQCTQAEKAYANGIFSLTNSLSYTELQFQLINDLIVIPIMVNADKKLNFILDTGTHSPIILNKKYVKDVDMQLTRDVSFQGAGNGKLVEGKVISSMSMQLGDAYAGQIGGILLEKNPLSNLQLDDVRIHGIIGATLFRSFAVEIDFVTQTLRLHKDQRFLEQHTYSAHDMEIEFSRPLLRTEVRTESGTYPLKLMVDTGFNNRMLIYKPETLSLEANKYSYIGKGYSGNVKAAVLNVKSLKLANRQIFDIDTFFPAAHSYKKEKEVQESSRDGIIGNKLLKQFCVVLDYAHEKLYLQEHLISKPALVQETPEEKKEDEFP